MPANRSRTSEWRRCLRQVHERGGGLEIALARPTNATADQPHLIWRVRILETTESEIVLEALNALGQTLAVSPGVQIVAMLCIGQNRWMFTTQCIATRDFKCPDGKLIPCLRVAMPVHVQRCQRRTHYRVETEGLSLPKAEIWPLLDPKSVLVAERACELQHAMAVKSGTPLPGSPKHGRPDAHSQELVMPEVGPRFIAEVLNLGGGGLGLRVAPDDSQTLMRHKLFWMRFTLPPAVSTPICATGKLVHTHMESTHETYAGLAFDFSFNPGHQKCVVDQICRYIAALQRAQLEQLADNQRKIA